MLPNTCLTTRYNKQYRMPREKIRQSTGKPSRQIRRNSSESSDGNVYDVYRQRMTLNRFKPTQATASNITRDETRKPKKKVRFISCQPTYCRNIAHESQKYTQMLGASKDKKLPRFYRPTCIAPGYPMVPGKDSIPRTVNYSRKIKLHPDLAAGIHLTSGGPVWDFNKQNPPKGTWLGSPVWFDKINVRGIGRQKRYIYDPGSDSDSESDEGS